MQIVEAINTVIITTGFTAGVINFGQMGRIGVRNAQVEKQARDVIGKYKTGYQTSCTYCSWCSPGKTSPSGSNEAGDCYIYTCSPGKYLSGSSCQNCAAGTYKTNSATAQSNCESCLSGKTSPSGSSSATSCYPTSCPAGQYADGSFCYNCLAGKYKTTTSTILSDCLSCPNGATSLAGATSVMDCTAEAGYYADITEATESTEVILTCNDGGYPSGFSHAPTNNPAGFPTVENEFCLNMCNLQTPAGQVCQWFFFNINEARCYYKVGTDYVSADSFTCTLSGNSPGPGYNVYRLENVETPEIILIEQCPSGSTSLPGATSEADCTANEGYYKVPASLRYSCPGVVDAVNSRCGAGTAKVAVGASSCFIAGCYGSPSTGQYLRVGTTTPHGLDNGVTMFMTADTLPNPSTFAEAVELCEGTYGGGNGGDKCYGIYSGTTPVNPDAAIAGTLSSTNWVVMKGTDHSGAFLNWQAGSSCTASQVSGGPYCSAHGSTQSWVRVGGLVVMNFFEQCPTGSTSTAGATSLADCTAEAGYWNDGVTVTQCPTGSTSLAGATSEADCTCLNGQEDLRRFTDSEVIFSPGTNLARTCGASFDEACPTDGLTNEHSTAGPVSAAVDGDLETYFYSHYNGGRWWAVDLGQDYYVTDLVYYAASVVTSRTNDIYLKIATNAQGSLSHSSLSSATLCGGEINGQTVASQKYTRSCPPNSLARYVYVYGGVDRLYVGELEVYGYGGESPAADLTVCQPCTGNKVIVPSSARCVCGAGYSGALSLNYCAGNACVASASSYHTTYYPAGAIDGEISEAQADSFHTGSTGSGQYLQIDLQSAQPIAFIRIYNWVVHPVACPRINGAKLYVTDTVVSSTPWDSMHLCATISSPADCQNTPYIDIACPGATGRYVVLRSGSDYINIYELEVYTSCTACLSVNDEYQPSAGESSCLTCAATDPLSTPTGDAATTCQCDAGATGSFGSCAACNPGYYKASPGPAACTECPTHSTSVAGKTSLLDCRCDAGYAPSDLLIAKSDIPRTSGHDKFDSNTYWRLGASLNGEWQGTLSYSAGLLQFTWYSDEASNRDTTETMSIFVHGTLVVTFYNNATCYPNSCIQTVPWPGPGEIKLVANSGTTNALSHGHLKSIEYFEHGNCVACESGKYKAYGMSNDACVSCTSTLEYSTSEGVGNIYCDCEQGYTLLEGQCVICTDGEVQYYKSSIGNESCTPCIANHAIAPLVVPNSVQVCKCVPGYFSASDSGSASCIPCAAGTYRQGLENGVTCTSCSTGGTTIASGASDSTYCIPDAGYYKVDKNSFTQCPENTFRKYDNTGSNSYDISSCTPCPHLSSSSIGSTSLTSCTCAHARVEGISGTPCECVAGFYEFEEPCAEQCSDDPIAGWYKLPGHLRTDTEDSTLASTTLQECAQFANANNFEQIELSNDATCKLWSDISLTTTVTPVITVVKCHCPVRPDLPSTHTCRGCPPNFFCPTAHTIVACPWYSTTRVLPEGTNLARACGATASDPCQAIASSEASNGLRPPSNLVDDNTNPNDSSGMWHSFVPSGNAYAGKEWARIDLGQNFLVTGLHVWNRDNYNNGRLDQAYLRVGIDAFADWDEITANSELCGQLVAASATDDCYGNCLITCNEIGRYVYILQHETKTDAFAFLELQVFGAESSSTTLTDCQCEPGRILVDQSTSSSPHRGECQQCTAGTYSKDGACKACPSNSNSLEGSTSADDCTANAGYFRTTSSSTISECPQNSYSVEGAFLQSHCLCNAGYTAQAISPTMRRLLDDFQCIACGYGKYKIEAGPSDCLDCPDDSSHSLTAETSAANCACNAGFTGNAGTAIAEACEQCNVGTYKVNTGSEACLECNTFREFSTSPIQSTSSSACECIAGHYLQASSCSECAHGKYKEISGDQACTDCPATGEAQSTTDEAGNIDDSNCVCPSGYTGTADACAACENGKYKTNSGSQACTDCPTQTTQTYDSMTAQIYLASCKCNAGYTSGGVPINTDPNPCVACVPGKYKDVVSVEICTDCPATVDYTTISTQGQPICKCPVGYTGNPDSCLACATGKYKDSDGTETCTGCPSSSTTPLTASQSIDSCICIAGYKSLGDHTCEACTAGKFKAAVNDVTTCSHCLDNSHSTSAATFCTCNAGFTGADGDGSACQQCEDGKFKTSSGSQACTNCPDTSQHTSIIPRTDQTDCLCNAGYNGDHTSTCTACGNGKYKPTIGTDACTDCPDSYHEETAALDVSACVCNAGFEGSAPGCTQCEAGKYSFLPAASRRRLLSVETCGDTYDSYQEPLFEQWVKFDHADNNGIFCRQDNEGDTLLNSFSGASGTCADGPDYWRESIEDSSKDINWCKDRCDNHDAIYSIQCHGFTYRTWTSKGRVFHECQIMLKADIITQAASTSTNARSWSIFTGYTYEVCSSPDPTCVDCPLHSDSISGSGNIADCTCNDGFVRFDNTCDITCPAGYEGDELAEADACVECGMGKYKSTTGSGACVACPEDSTHSLQGQTLESSCICQQGHIPSATADLYCESCSDGDSKSSFNNFDGETVCYDCNTATNGLTCSNILVEAVPAGMGVTNENIFECAAGTWNDGLYLTCQDCPTPSTNSGPAGATAESDCYCAAGYERINNVCTACRVGAYKDNVGAGLCQDCASGFTTFATASNLANDCVCAQDFGWDGSTCASCDSISSNHFKFITGNVACIECADNGAYTGSHETHDVLYCACNPGFKSVLTGKVVTSCIPCPDGSFRDQINKLTGCISCGENTISTVPRTANSDCACDTPQYMEVNGVCVNSCELGTYFSDADDSCIDCVGGNGIDATGTFRDEIADLLCSECTAPRLASLAGSDSPTNCQCPDGKVGIDISKIVQISALGAYGGQETHALFSSSFNDDTKILHKIILLSATSTITLTRGTSTLKIMECDNNCPNEILLGDIRASISIIGSANLITYSKQDVTMSYSSSLSTALTTQNLQDMQNQADRLAVQYYLQVGSFFYQTEYGLSDPTSNTICIECPPKVACALIFI